MHKRVIQGYPFLKKMVKMALRPLTRSINKIDIDLFLNYKIKKAENFWNSRLSRGASRPTSSPSHPTKLNKLAPTP